MIDKTTVGITAEPEEVEAVLHNLCGYHLAERDPVFRYTVLTREQVLYDALVAAIKRERGRALQELVASGTTLTNAASLTNLTSRQQVQRLIAIAKAAEAAEAEIATAAEAAVAEVRAASLDFEQRMAAVEATLDEVVSGIVPPAAADPAPLDVWAETGAGAIAFGPGDAPADQVPVVPGMPVVPVVPGALDAATQILPTLASVTPATTDLPAADDSRWWRRNRDTGAA